MAEKGRGMPRKRSDPKMGLRRTCAAGVRRCESRIIAGVSAEASARGQTVKAKKLPKVREGGVDFSAPRRAEAYGAQSLHDGRG